MSNHEWMQHGREGWSVCSRCGMVRNYDRETTCSGALPKIRQRSAAAERDALAKQVAMADHRPLPVSEGDVYSHPRGPEQVLIDHVTEDEVLLRVTDGNCGLIAARRMSRAEWDRIRDSHELRRSNV